MKTNERLLALVMFTAIGLVILLSATSCGSAKYHPCDAYKTKCKPLKADHHKKHHHTCDAYN